MGNIRTAAVRIALSLALVLTLVAMFQPTPTLAVGTCGTGTWTPGNLEIHHINVGEGDSTLIVGPTGKSLLFDVGESNWNSSAGARTVGPYIENVLGCKSLDYVVLSHFHADHAGYVGYGGLWHLVESQGFTVGTSFVRNYKNYLGDSSGTFTNWKTYLEGAGQAKLHPLTVVEGTSQVNLGPGVTFNIVTLDGNGAVFPGDFHADANPPSENDYSIGALLSFGNFDEWIGGDLDGEYQVSGFGYSYHDIELSAAREIGDVDVYKVNHHGSSHSSNATFVNELDPEVSIVTVGNANSYGHPTQSVMDRLLATSAVYMTERGDTNTNIGSATVAGNIVIKTSNGSTYTVDGTPFTATEPSRSDVDGDGYFAEADPNDANGNQIPATNGGCDPTYQTCAASSLACQVTLGQVLINEVLPAPSNNGTEWIELYNTTSSTINIGSCNIDDSVGGSAAYQIPASTMIPAHGFWTLDRNSYFNNTGDDARFLKEDGNTVLDSYTFGTTAYDVSRYRLPDGGPWAGSPTASTTKGQSNTIPFYPIVSSIVQADANPASTNVLHFTVTFSKPVTGVGLDDLTLTATGLTGTWISAVSGSGTTYSVTVTTGFEDGTVRLDVIDNDTILDSNAHPLGGAGKGNGNFTSGETYTIKITKVFDNGIWWIQKGDAPVIRSPMSVYVNGVYHGATRLLQYGHKRDAENSWPEIAAMYNIGYVRLVPYNLPYGTSFILGPAYWENAAGTPRYFHDLQISRVDINTSALNPTTGKGLLQLTVYARDYSSTYWPNYHLNITYNITLPDPQSSETQMSVVQTYTVANAFSLSSTYQSGHEGSKLMQFSSMYMDGTYHDSDGTQYPNQSGNIVSSDFAALTCGTAKFPSPQPLSAEYPWAEVSHHDDAGWQGNTPNTLVILNSSILVGQIVPQGLKTCSGDPNNDNIDFWLNDESAPTNFAQGYSKSVQYTLISRDNPTNLHVSIGGHLRGTYSIDSDTSNRVNYSIDNGPASVASTDGAMPVLSSQRFIYSYQNSRSYAEMMGYPGDQLATEYWFPWYNNLSYSTQLRVSNMGSNIAQVKVYAGTNELDSFTIQAGQGARKSYQVDSGPLHVVSTDGVTPILASERFIQTFMNSASYAEMMGYPGDQLATEYWFPWYNNLSYSTQLRVSNLGSSEAQIKVYAGTNELDSFMLSAGQGARKSYSVDNGPLHVVSTDGVTPILASERFIQTFGTSASYAEMMGYPGDKLTTEYCFPWYNNVIDAGVVLSSQLRVSNMSAGDTPQQIKVYLAGAEIDSFYLKGGEGKRVSYPSKNNGPLCVKSMDGATPILTSERFISTYLSSSSYSEMMGYPTDRLAPAYWFPWYNNLSYSTELRLAKP